MTSKIIKKIAADSNVILSAVIGKAALRIFSNTDIEFITTDFNLLEVEKYLPRLALKYKLNERLLIWQLKMLPLRILSKDYYQSHFAIAHRLLKERDPDDAPLAALALKENIPIWSNDHDFKNIPVPIYTTAEFLALLQKVE